MPDCGLGRQSVLELRVELSKFRNTSYIKNQSRAAIAHNGCAAIAGHLLQLLTQRLDHDFLRVADAIDHQAKLLMKSCSKGESLLCRSEAR